METGALRRRWAGFCLALLLAGFASSCAGIIEIKTPREFDGKKKIEDPPITYRCPQTVEEATA